MREIKFRAWDNELKIMVRDFDQGLDKHYPLKVGDSIHNLVWRVGLCYESLMQYTGIKDRNGRGDHELCQDDLVLCSGCGIGRVDKNAWGEWCVFFGVACEKEGEFHETIHDLIMEQDLLECVGNIHENPELLEQQ